MGICKETFLSRCVRAAICIAALVILTGAAYAEMQEETKTLHKTKTENGVSVRIEGSRGGRERVLMDCGYDTAQFPYYFDRYAAFGGNDDIFYQFYMDQFVWEKVIHAENPDRAYTLYYAQNKLYDSEDQEKTAGYEGHLWVLDEETRIVKRLFWRSDAPYIKIVWKKNGLFIQYADGSKRTCTLPELLQDPAEAVCERCKQLDFTAKTYAVDTEKCDAATDRAYKDAYYRALIGGQRVRTAEDGDVYLKEFFAYQGDLEMEVRWENCTGSECDTATSSCFLSLLSLPLVKEQFTLLGFSLPLWGSSAFLNENRISFLSVLCVFFLFHFFSQILVVIHLLEELERFIECQTLIWMEDLFLSFRNAILSVSLTSPSTFLSLHITTFSQNSLLLYGMLGGGVLVNTNLDICGRRK